MQRVSNKGSGKYGLKHNPTNHPTNIINPIVLQTEQSREKNAGHYLKSVEGVTTKQAQALTNRTKKHTNHRAIGKLGTGQMGKRANHNTNHSTHSINTIGGTTQITKITEITRASSGSEKHKGSVTHRSEQKRNTNQRIKGKSARGKRAKGEIGTGPTERKPNQSAKPT